MTSLRQGTMRNREFIPRGFSTIATKASPETNQLTFQYVYRSGGTPETYHLSPCKAEIKPFNAELNSIRHLLALVGAHHILYVSRVRVKNVWTSKSIPPPPPAIYLHVLMPI